jgi:hypothetical protein
MEEDIMNFEIGDLVTFIPYSNDDKYKNRLGVITEIRDNKLYRYRVKWIDYTDDEEFTYEGSELKKL